MAQETPVRAAVYARQSVAEELGLAQQVADCRAYLSAVHPSWDLAGIYEDNATSATKDRGPKSDWARMLRDFDAGLFDAVICVRVDRLLRRVVDVVELRKPARPRDVRIVAYGSSLDTGEAMGGAMLTILVALAEAEIEVKGARAARYAVDRRAAGHPWPGRTPYGYDWVPELHRDKRGTRWAVVPAEAAVVKRIFREFKTKKLSQIAAGLNADGIGSPSGKTWHTPTLRRILLSPFVAGLLPPAQGWADFKPERVVVEECTPGAWSPIVSRDAYIAARHKLLDPGRRTNPEGTARKWLLSGLGLCSKCRAPIRSARTREGFHGYRCPNGHFLRRGERLDDYVAGAVVQRLSEPDAASLLAPPAEGLDVATLAALRGSLDDRERALAEAIGAGLSALAAQPSIDAIRAEREAVTARLAAALTVDPLAAVVGAVDVRAAWDRLALPARRAVLDALVVPIITPVGKGARVLDLEGAARTVLLLWRDHAGKDAAAFPDWAAMIPGDLGGDAREQIAGAVT